jgi:hypothetical protein
MLHQMRVSYPQRMRDVRFAVRVRDKPAKKDEYTVEHGRADLRIRLDALLIEGAIDGCHVMHLRASA